ncbi:hypothetical protein I4F81_011414 [Pyropia yezoensis]|uniref:Uncharacterized protein n=1 Tax=Pyropia yezoensis TaxID=2788 RepID=A0ACC3CGP3_PYRYE|nr:hypothetical protein I4F81_011414 [Neopyropia yezoensis]
MGPCLASPCRGPPRPPQTQGRGVMAGGPRARASSHLLRDTFVRRWWEGGDVAREPLFCFPPLGTPTAAGYPYRHRYCHTPPSRRVSPAGRKADATTRRLSARAPPHPKLWATTVSVPWPARGGGRLPRRGVVVR